MTDVILKPLTDKVKELDKELNKYLGAIQDMQNTILAFEAVSVSMTAEKVRIENAIEFLRNNMEGWNDITT